MTCKCHPNSTFCPDLVCIDFEDDVPVFVHRNSAEGKEAVARMEAAEVARDREEFERLKAKHGWQ